jgi:hypothetical protein
MEKNICDTCTKFIKSEEIGLCDQCDKEFHYCELFVNPLQDENRCGDEYICRKCFNSIQPKCKICSNKWDDVKKDYICNFCEERYHIDCCKPILQKMFYDTSLIDFFTLNKCKICYEK